MNCAMPWAPIGEIANGLKLLSANSCAASSAAETFQRCAARASAGANRTGTNDGNARDERPSPEPLPPAPAPPPAGSLRGVERGLSV
jgi:hypothetical protein